MTITETKRGPFGAATFVPLPPYTKREGLHTMTTDKKRRPRQRTAIARLAAALAYAEERIAAGDSFKAAMDDFIGQFPEDKAEIIAGLTRLVRYFGGSWYLTARAFPHWRPVA